MIGKNGPTVNVKEARTGFVQAAKTFEKFGKANTDKHLVELEFPQNSP